MQKVLSSNQSPETTFNSLATELYSEQYIAKWCKAWIPACYINEKGISSDSIKTYLIDKLIVMNNSHQVLVKESGHRIGLGPSYSSENWQDYCSKMWPSVHGNSVPMAHLSLIEQNNIESIKELVFPICWHADHNHYWHFIFEIAFRLYYLKITHPSLLAEITFLVVGQDSLSPFQESVIKAILGFLPCIRYVASCALCETAIFIPPVNTLIQKRDLLREYSSYLRNILTKDQFANIASQTQNERVELRRANIYISRGSAKNPRFLINEKELVMLLEKKGFTPKDPGSMSIQDQACLFNGVDIVLGLHGAAFTNLIFMEERKFVTELTHSLYDPPTLFLLAKQLGLHHIRLCRHVETMSGSPHSPFNVDLNMVKRWIERF